MRIGNRQAPGKAPTQRASPLRRSLAMTLIVFALIMGGIAVFAFLAGDPADLPFEYQGFD